jgi:translocation and assembly module TamB
MRIVIAAVWTVAVACLVSLPAGLWWLGTDRGTAWLIGFVEERAGPRFAVGGVEGGLWGRVTLRDVRLALGSDEVRVDEASVELDFSTLVAGTLGVDDLRIEAASYRRGPPTASGAGPGFALPLRIAVRQGSITRLTLAVGERPLEFEAIRLSGAMQGNRLEIEALATRISGVAVSSSGQIELGDPLHLAVSGAWEATLGGQAFRGRARAAGDWPRLSLEHQLEAPFESTIDGDAVFDGEPLVALDVGWRDLAWPTVPWLASPNGAMRVDGTLGDFTFSGSGTLRLQEEAVAFEVSGRGARANITIEPLALRHPGGSLSATGRVSLAERRWALALVGSELDPAVRLPEWPGRLQATARFEGALSPTLEWTVDALELAGHLRGRPLTAGGAVAFAAPGTWRLADVYAESGESRFEAEGTIIGEALDLEVGASVGDLGELWPPLSGALSGRGHVGGTRRAPALTADLTGEGLALGEYSARRVRLAGRGGVAADAPLEVEMTLTEPARGALKAVELRAELDGTTATHGALLELQAERATARLGLMGGVEQAAWQGSLNEVAIAQSALGDWRLLEPAELLLAAGRANLAPMCLAQAAARVCAEAVLLGGTDDRVEVTAHAFDLRALAPILPPELEVAGVYEAAFSISDFGAAPTGAFSLTGGPTTITMALAGREPFTVGLTATSVSAMLADAALDVDGTMLGAEGARASLQAHIGNLAGSDQDLDGRLDVAWPDLGFLGVLTPDVGEVGGRLTIGLSAGGTLDQPQLQGRAELDGGRVTVPRWGLTVDSIEANARSVDGTLLEFLATGEIGDGEVDIRGTTELDPRAGWPTRLNLRGESVLAVQRPDAQVFVTPDIDVEVALPDIYARGTVHIPRASIVLAELPAQAVSPSGDAVVHGVVQERVDRPLQTHADLRFTLGEDVRYSGLGLTAAVTGDLALMHESGQVPIASGTVGLEGQYDAYGQPLALERGQLLFNGPWDDPALDVRAVRHIEETNGETVVGVQLSGTLKRPETRLFSEPAMSEADALSYLLLGRPLTGTEEQEAATLQSAAISMGLQQALPAVQRIGQTLGLDELTVESTTSDAGALAAGKYLSPRIYIRYSYGLFSRIGGFLLRFRLNDRLSIETRSGDQQSMDLLYTVEKE